jgi:hypothetical protein
MNRNNHFAYLLFALLLVFNIKAQDPFYRTYDWDASPKVTAPEALDQSEGQIVLKDLRVSEYAYEKSGDLITYVTKHRKVKVFSDKGIENNNKVYIPSSGVIEFMQIKARSISPSGKISNIEKSAIKEVDDVESKGSYKMFAIEGIEKNSEIEYLYTYKKSGGYFGTEYAQSALPKLNFSYKIICPSNLVFDPKLYNSNSEVKKDTLSGNRNVVTINLPKIDPLKEEKYSFYNANLIRIEYKLAYNSVKGKARLLTWDNAADRYYHIICDFDKKDISETNSFLKKLKLSGSDDLAKIRQLENHLKMKFETRTGSSEDNENIEKILSSKIANHTGITRLYMCCFAQMGIKAEVVLSCDRTDRAFDPDFDSWDYLAHYLIYLPGSNTFMSPTNIYSRVGFVPPEYTGQKSLFVKEVDLGAGEVKSAIAKLKTITYPEYTASQSNMEANVKFKDDWSETVIALTQTYTGYGAYYTQPIIMFLSDLQKKEFQEKTLKTIGDDASMDKVTMTGIAEEEILTKPFVMGCTLKSPSLLEKAGNKYLFKVGLLIGPQAEMYQEGARKTPAEITFTHSYNRKLVITVPDGFKVLSIEKLKINQNVMIDDKIAAEFVSDYKLTGNTLEINVVENYRALYYPIAKFEDYRKVINAAADFNKIQLVFEKN